MKKLFLLFFIPLLSLAQTIPSRWDELTASDWELALEKSNSLVFYQSEYLKNTVHKLRLDPI